MRQVNIVGTSPPSLPSRRIQTLQAPPDTAPANVTLRTASETSLWLRWMVRGGTPWPWGGVCAHGRRACRGRREGGETSWGDCGNLGVTVAISAGWGQPLLEQEYNGNPDAVGYKIRYARSDGRGQPAMHVIHDRVEREYTIEDLEEWTEYRVQVQAFNAIGSGPWSRSVVGRTRESGTAVHPAAPGTHPGWIRPLTPALTLPSSAFLRPQQRFGAGHLLQQHAGAMERHSRGRLQRPHPGLQGEHLPQPRCCDSACLQPCPVPCQPHPQTREAWLSLGWGGITLQPAGFPVVPPPRDGAHLCQILPPCSILGL